ncbi:MAG: excalibur calcium-binding domain-containing protein [Rhodobacter sp.]|nr:excalibur calcium-binding domain-containing protein [Rhodobacter sp.]
MRILLRVLLIPVVAAGLTVSIYARTSPFGMEDGLKHLLAMGGCDAAAALGLAPAFEGELGYHKRNDPDGDGVACGGYLMIPAARAGGSDSDAAPAPDTRRAGGAKFVRP